MDYRITPTEWDVTYPARVEPIGRIRREADGFHAWMDQEHLGVYPNGDRAVEAVWERFLEATRAQHEHASVTHGAYERHAHI